MLKGLGVLALMALLVVATIGMAGQGPVWVRYVGSGTMFFLLMLILTQLSNMPDKAEYRRMMGHPDGQEVFSAEDSPVDRGLPHDRDVMGRN